MKFNARFGDGPCGVIERLHSFGVGLLAFCAVWTVAFSASAFWEGPSDLFAVQSAEAQAPELTYDLQDYIALVKNQHPEVQLGVQVTRVDDRKLIFAVGENDKLIPASVLKLATTYAALRFLGPGYRFPTEIFLTHLPKELAAPGQTPVDFSEPQESVKDLFIRGYGDPTMDSSSLRTLTDALPRYGVKQVENVILDDTLFVEPPRASGDKAHEAGLGALSINYNTFTVYVAPGAFGQNAVVTLTDGAPYDLINRVRTTKSSVIDVTVNLTPSATVSVTGGDDPAREFFSTVMKYSVNVQGTFGNRKAGAAYFFAAPDLAGYFASLVRDALSKSSVQVKGKFRRGEVPADAKLLQTSESPELAEVIRTLNHLSSNMMAGQLVFALGQDPGGYFRYERGLERIRSALEKLGEPPESFDLVDGSGLDRGNRITAATLVKVLIGAYEDFSLGPDFVASLSRFGQIGTLKDRELLEPLYLETLRGEEREEARLRAGSVRAKTGTLDGVSALAGYAQLKTGEKAAFAIMSNGLADKNQAVKIEDSIVRLLLGFPAEYHPSPAVPKVAPPGTVTITPAPTATPEPTEGENRLIGDSPVGNPPAISLPPGAEPPAGASGLPPAAQP